MNFCRSWHKYEEEKKYLPRNFSFETINDNDALSRNLNEIHTCVIPKQEKYRIFKTAEELAANHFELNTTSENVLEQLKDPRRNVYEKLEPSHELIKEYSYSSVLKKNEQLNILNSLKGSIVYNPKFLKTEKCEQQQSTELPKSIEEKWLKEVEHFQRCAEISYHRQITQFNNITCETFNKVLLNKWQNLQAQFPKSNYQAITMLLRSSMTRLNSPLIYKFHESIPADFKPDLYTIPENLFPNLQNNPAESLEMFIKSKDLLLQHNVAMTFKPNVEISLDVLTKLFVDGTEFNTIFINDKNCSKFILNETVPLKTITQIDALEEAVKLILNFNIEWNNASKCVRTIEQRSQNIDFKLHSINESMSKIFKNYKKHAGFNNEINLWTLETGSQKLSIAVSNNNCYFMDDQTKVIMSIKLEYQTTFGAEQTTKEELLKEWIQIKMIKDAVILRLRIDVKSLEILSITKLKIEDVEIELKESHKFDPHEALEVLFNTLNCIHNLPESEYIVQAQRSEKDCSKLLIYKEVSENGRSIINDEEFKISDTFARKWIPIDKKIPTFIHINEEMAPCCFTYKSSQKISYIMPNKSQKSPKKKVVDHKSPLKMQILRKRTRSKNKKKRPNAQCTTAVKSLNKGKK